MISIPEYLHAHLQDHPLRCFQTVECGLSNHFRLRNASWTRQNMQTIFPSYSSRWWMKYVQKYAYRFLYSKYSFICSRLVIISTFVNRSDDETCSYDKFWRKRAMRRCGGTNSERPQQISQIPSASVCGFLRLQKLIHLWYSMQQIYLFVFWLSTVTNSVNWSSR